MPTSTLAITSDVLANRGQRFLNFIIDYVVQIVIGAVIGVVIALLAEFTGNYMLYDIVVESNNRLTDYLLGFIILILYYLTIETLTARSLGKYITQTKIVLEDGSQPKFTDILKRSFSRLIPFEQFSFFGEDARGWHDTISDTYVIDVKKYERKTKTAIGLEEIGKVIE